jgi:pimeloyl-ACP methyl ester carboxylesterase
MTNALLLPAETRQEPTSHFVTVNGLTLHYLEQGHGETVIWLHGFPEAATTWLEQLQVHSTHFHCLAFDLKGFGQSDKPENRYAPDVVAMELTEALDALCIKDFHLVAMDLGSIIGDFLVAQNPHRVRSYVRLQSTFQSVSGAYPNDWMILNNPLLTKALLADARDFLVLWYSSRTIQHIPPPVLERLALELKRPGAAQAIPRYFRDLPSNFVDRQMRLHQRMALPVLLVQGDMDATQLKTQVEHITQQFLNARLAWIYGVGHAPHLEKPADISRTILSFLQQHTNAANPSTTNTYKGIAS